MCSPSRLGRGALDEVRDALEAGDEVLLPAEVGADDETSPALLAGGGTGTPRS